MSSSPAVLALGLGGLALFALAPKKAAVPLAPPPTARRCAELSADATLARPIKTTVHAEGGELEPFVACIDMAIASGAPQSKCRALLVAAFESLILQGHGDEVVDKVFKAIAAGAEEEGAAALRCLEQIGVVRKVDLG